MMYMYNTHMCTLIITLWATGMSKFFIKLSLNNLKKLTKYFKYQREINLQNYLLIFDKIIIFFSYLFYKVFEEHIVNIFILINF